MKGPLPGARPDAPPPYDGQERFTDGDFKVFKGWEPELVKRALQIGEGEPKADVEVQLAAAEEACQLEPAAFAAMRKAGFVFP